MAANDKPRKVRKLRESSKTVREQSSVQRRVSDKPSRQRSLMTRIGKSGFWKPFKVVLRFLGKYLVPPYFKNSWRELRMVTWPNRKQTKQLTFAVIVFSVIFGVLVAILDYGLDKLFKKVILNI